MRARLVRAWGGPLGVLAAAILALAVALAGPVAGQGTTQPVSGAAIGTAAVKDTAAIDYSAWDSLAKRVETALLTGNIASSLLNELRAEVVKWRDAFMGAQKTNAARIDTLKQQIKALGPAPAAGKTEPAAVAKRRAELEAQLKELQAPSVAASEAFHRADGLIAEIDNTLRQEQTTALLKLWPNPLNPGNWGQAANALSKLATTLWDETANRVQDPLARQGLGDNFPLILIYLLVALGLLARGRRWMARLVDALKARSGTRAADVWDFMGALAEEAVLPALGLGALSAALNETGMLGPVGASVFGDLGWLGLIVLSAIWLGKRAFPDGEGGLGLVLEPGERARLRLLAALLGVDVLAVRLLHLLDGQMRFADAANAVLSFPVVVAGGAILWDIGRTLARHRPAVPVEEEEAPVNYRDRSLALLARAAVAIGLISPVLAVAGYNTAAQALVFPAARSLALIALLVLVQRLVADLVALTARREAAAEGLAPVLVGMGLTLATLPVFALIWGAQVSDLTDLWARFLQGFQIGKTLISPAAFLVFAVIFAIGFTLTRLLQGAMRSSILPRTRLDQGGQNAVVSVLGYLGIFLAAVVAIYSAGIDLSGLAIVAGALSVGIGFGLQNVVSNFVSGVILLVERPVSEGDWIEVGGSQGIVKSISVRATRIQTWDRSDVIVPNSDLITGKVTNWTRFNLTGRLIVPVGVAYGTDTRRVEKILMEIAEAQPLVLLNPPPMVLFTGFGASSLDFEIRAILRDVTFILAVKNEINHQIAERFTAEGIEVPFNQMDVMLKNAEALGKALRDEAATQEPPQEIPTAPGDAG